jgi:type II secretory pathway pseudopilin PulG
MGLLYKKLESRKGQTLLEALIALSALVIILTAVSVAVLTSINNSSFLKQQNQANKLAQQGMEYIRDRINSSNKFSTYSVLTGAKCFNEVSSGYGGSGGTEIILANSCAGVANIGGFIREVTFVSQDCDTSGAVLDFSDGLQAKVDVYWSSGKCPVTDTFCHKQEVRSCFINPKKVSPTKGQGI